METKNQYADASELGLAPGEWPATLGDGYWIRLYFNTRHGELDSVTYGHGDEDRLEVFND
jgi:hypothetical protein